MTDIDKAINAVFDECCAGKTADEIDKEDLIKRLCDLIEPPKISVDDIKVENIGNRTWRVTLNNLPLWFVEEMENEAN